MSDVPAVRYARSGGVNIAYCRWGAGPEKVVYTPPLVSNVELFWELPEWRRLLDRAGRHHDTVMLDKRGVGLSDRVAAAPTLADRIADTLAVIDAEDLGPVHLVGQSEGGPIAVAIAALHPERVRSVTLMGAPAQGATAGDLAALADEDHPYPTPAQLRETFAGLVRSWGSASSVNLDLFAPGVAHDPRIRRWYQRFERQSASPGSVLAFFRSMTDVDITPFLGRVEVPTLVVHSRGDRIVHAANGRFLAQAIRGARYVELDDDDHISQLTPAWRELHDVVLEFVLQRPPEVEVRGGFATVLFTDLVGSTAREAEVGDRAWGHLLDAHDRLSAELVAGGGGRIVKQTGDGLLATFDDPAQAVRCAVDLGRQLPSLGLRIRAGVHAGRVEWRSDGDVSGITVNIAARVQALAAADEVLVSRTVRDLLLGGGFSFAERGSHQLKGVDGTWDVFRAVA